MQAEQRWLPVWLVCFCALILVSIVLFFRLGSPTKKETVPAPSPKQLLLDAPHPPQVRFTDITVAAGLAFTHVNGAAGEKLLPETMGGGCAFLDFDADGDQDLLLVNSTFWTNSVPGGDSAPTAHLYQNDGAGRFKDVTRGSRLDISFYGMGPAVGDFDNDGLPDVFMSAVGQNHLFHNEGDGRFKEVTASAGVAGSKDQWSTSCGWFDYNNDGRLDLFVCNYIR